VIGATVALLKVLTLLSAPVAFAIGLAVAIGLALFSPFPMAIVIQKMVTGIDNFVLGAIPLFILTGNLMNAGGITDRIFAFVRACVGHLPAGLAHANVGASVVFSGVSGATVADAAGMGAIELKAMTDAGYERPFSAAVTAASAVIGPIIPPSIPMILYGVIAEVSIGQLFAAGIVPGLILAVTLSAQIAWMSRGGRFPRDPRARAAEVWNSFRSGFFALATPVVVLGGLLGGVFTPTEAGAVAAGYALAVSLLVYRSLAACRISYWPGMGDSGWHDAVHSVQPRPSVPAAAGRQGLVA
jgi:tripartite ATP-independent transporter DctM subunit